ncbi:MULTISPECIES: VapD family protein [unclassified Breznakia]|uniref:VapD family protein n=1 Tax=unclassified Breznakia TaxID=2623764 RepID=UPI002474C294|nr:MULTISPECIES: VapD family protein [unclassified Breznakia]MDH6367382.1 virulence-associated protein VapD [Breznakia sp. PH1-1]MDH6403914.1 virulence-associated protein VapD [Breznakia sp. PF1-11]MDH6411623.1 virulence-associated protein VapD [Breznakia sp. PFB1-11]MDH6414549.1 virulence-associated protein VapD [Breznakia sp. PFB1-14]MDH6418655.1 virulence-associated protein VapD [Breznakia sp. PFB1-12]
MPQTKKTVNFDLDTNLLQKYYPKDNWRQSYQDLRSFLEKNGFEHRQGSGYISSRPISISKITLLVKEITVEFDWFAYCVKKFDVASVGKEFSFIDVICESINSEVVDELESINIIMKDELHL